MTLFAKTGVFGDGQFLDTGMTDTANEDGWHTKSCNLGDGINQCERPQMIENE